jgi:hypothetical protein
MGEFRFEFSTTWRRLLYLAVPIPTWRRLISMAVSSTTWRRLLYGLDPVLPGEDCYIEKTAIWRRMLTGED